MGEFINKLWENRAIFWLVCVGVIVLSVVIMIGVNLITSYIQKKRERIRKEIAEKHRKKKNVSVSPS